MSELIDRQTAIDAILHITNCKSVRELFEYNQEHHLTEMWSGGVNDAIDAVIGVESATDNNVGTELSTNLAEVGTDCISRQAAINAIDECYCGGEDSCGEPWIYQENAVEAIQMIEPIPSAKPKRIRGKWIEYEQEFMLEGSLETVQKTVKECSVCTTKIAGMVGIMNFCPNCGAEMEANNESN